MTADRDLEVTVVADADNVGRIIRVTTRGEGHLTVLLTGRTELHTGFVSDEIDDE